MVLGPTSLRRAIQGNDIPQVKKILQESENPSDVINNDFAPNCWFSMCTPSIGNAFYYAVGLSRLEIVEIFIANGADIYSSGYYGESSLHLSVRICNFDIVKLLVNAGIDVNVTDDYGRSIFISAASSPFNTSIMLDYLMKKYDCSALLQQADYQGRTPLHMAIIYGNSNALEYLLSYGADINAKTNKGDTIHDLAKLALNSRVKDIVAKLKLDND